MDDTINNYFESLKNKEIQSYKNNLEKPEVVDNKRKYISAFESWWEDNYKGKIGIDEGRIKEIVEKTWKAGYKEGYEWGQEPTGFGGGW